MVPSLASGKVCQLHPTFCDIALGDNPDPRYPYVRSDRFFSQHSAVKEADAMGGGCARSIYCQRPIGITTTTTRQCTTPG